MKGQRPRLDEYQRAAELRAALRSFLRASEQTARRHRLTPQRYMLLLMIKGAPNGSERSTVTELAQRLQLAQSTVTELVRRAETVGLIRREPSAKDGRVAYLSLSEEGERRLAGAIADLGPEHRRLADVVGDAGANGRQ
jgi:DNA-binding MarR family transcriptional regulator